MVGRSLLFAFRHFFPWGDTAVPLCIDGHLGRRGRQMLLAQQPLCVEGCAHGWRWQGMSKCEGCRNVTHFSCRQWGSSFLKKICLSVFSYFFSIVFTCPEDREGVEEKGGVCENEVARGE